VIPHLGPLAVKCAELTVFVTIGVGFSIFEPEQAQGNALPTQLYVDLVPVGKRNNSRRRTGTFGEEEPKEIVLTKAFRKWPAKTNLLCAAQILPDGAVGDGATVCDRPVRETALPLQAKDFVDLAHG
jgi:hypothetical protein